MLVFHSHCQLGNQMFIYSCAHSLANHKGSSYCISGIKDLKYFKLTKFEILLNSFKYLFFRINSKIVKYKYHHYQDNRTDYHKKMLEEKSKNKLKMIF